MCFVWIWEQTAIISLYSINWLVCITETECVYCAVRTVSLNIVQVVCFVWISEQTAIISLYNINWLVFTTGTECVYCAVRTGSLTRKQQHNLGTYDVRQTSKSWNWKKFPLTAKEISACSNRMHVKNVIIIIIIIIIVIEIIIIIIIIIIYCSWVVTRWQWLFYMYTKYEIGY